MHSEQPKLCGVLAVLRTIVLQCSARLRFCTIVAQIFKMTQPKLSPRDIGRSLIFGMSQDFESVSCVENSHAKNNLVFHRNSHSLIGVLDF